MSQLSASEAKAEAQRIAFGPLVFWAVDAMKQLGVLELLWTEREHGCSRTHVAERLGLSPYAVTVLFESGQSAGVLEEERGTFRLSKVGYFLLRDEMTQVNFDFVRDVCYRPATHLAASLKEGRPVGLAELGAGRTVYEALSGLPLAIRQSWFAFDHFYSDRAFDAALELTFRGAPRTILDIGANTGKFALACLTRDPAVRITLVDLPAQLDGAAQLLTAAGHGGRFELCPRDLLGEDLVFPGKMDVVWFSQLLDCFPEDRIVALLEAAQRSLAPEGYVYVLEPCWDRQPQESGKFCLQQTSLYFSCVANGDSRMYSEETLCRLIEQAGLELIERHHSLGVGHSLLISRAGSGTPPRPLGRAPSSG